MRFPRHRARPLQPVPADVGGLAVALVAAPRLAQGVLRPRHVEDVVDDLEEEPELGREGTEVSECSPRGLPSTEKQYAFHGRADESARLELVRPAEARGARGYEVADVDVLAADHAVDARGRGQLADRGEDVGRLALLLVQDEAEGLGVEPVAGQDRDVLAVLDVACRPPPAQLVVVHGGEIVVDERVRVDELERRRERQHGRGVTADRLGRGGREHGTDALAAGEQRVAHRLLEPGHGQLPAAEAQAVEVGLHLLAEMVRIARRGEVVSETQCPSASWPAPGSTSPARTWRSTSTLASPARRADSSTTAAAPSGSMAPDRSSAAARSRRSVRRSSVSDGTRGLLAGARTAGGVSGYRRAARRRTTSSSI